MKKELLVNDTMMALSKAMVETQKAVAEMDPDYQDPRLQRFAGDITQGVTALMDIGLDLMRHYAETEGEKNLLGGVEPFEWHQQKECRVIGVDHGSLYVEWEEPLAHESRQARFNTSDLGVNPTHGGIKRRDGTTYKGWSFKFVVGETGDGGEIHQSVAEGTRGWICTNTTEGVTRFIPRPVDQQ